MSEAVNAVVEQVVAQSQEEKPLEATSLSEFAPSKEEKPIEAPSKSEDDFSSKFAALSRRDKQLLERERKLKAMEEEQTQRGTVAKSWEEKKKEFKQNPDALLNEVGLTFEELINLKLGIQEEPKKLSPDEMYKQIKEEMEASFKKIEDEKIKAKEDESTQILESFKHDIESHITKNADKYELINYQGDHNLVFEVIQEYYNLNNEVLSIEAAADHVEKHLEDLVMGATKLKKVASKFAPKPAEVQPKAESAQETKLANEVKKADSPVAPTLSNHLNSSNSSFKGPAATLEESKKRAAALLRWT
jgi:hypothetical protein